MAAPENNKNNTSFLDEIVRNPIYWICLGIITCLSFLFDMTNRTVGVDDLARAHYIGSGNTMLAGTRWGMTVWTNLLSSTIYVPFIDKFLGVLFLIISVLLFSRIFYIYFYDNRYRLALCTLFSCLFISFPLINEIWNYNFANTVISANTAIAAFCILLLYDNEKLISKKTLLCAALLSLVVSSYEASAFLYVSAVLSILLMDCILFGRKDWIIRGIRYAVPLVLAVILRYAIGFAVIRIMHLQYSPNGESGIYWNFAELSTQILSVIDTTLDYYFARGLIYLPITVFVLSLFFGSLCIIFVSLRKRSFTIFLIYILLCISLFFMTIIQGSLMPYRTAQTIQYFSAFSLTFFLFALTYLKRRCFFIAAFLFIGFICYRQGVFLNKTFALNNQRSDNEAAAAYSIGTRLKSMYDDKPVIFVGDLDLGDFINRQNKPDESTIGGYLYRKIALHLGWKYDKTEIYGTNVNSLINWNVWTQMINNLMMTEYFSYYGFDITIPEKLTWGEFDIYTNTAIEEEMKPLEIKDMGDYLLVFLG